MVTNWEETIKLPLNEPAPGKRKSQIQVDIIRIFSLSFHWSCQAESNLVNLVGNLTRGGLIFFLTF